MRSTSTHSELINLLHEGLLQMHQNYSRDVEHQLIRFIELIYSNNKVLHLTSIRDLDVMVSRHLLDSLSISPYIHANRVLDVGTGAGLPGVPLAIVMPQYHFVLLDSHQKKIQFLQQMSYKLRLNNIQIVHEHVEKYHTENLFDAIVCRSYGMMPDFLNQVQSLILPGGRVLAMKGVYPETEATQVKSPFELVKVHALHVPYLNAERHLMEIIYQP